MMAVYPTKDLCGFRIQGSKYHNCRSKADQGSKTPSEPDDVEKGYESDSVEAYDVVSNQETARLRQPVIMRYGTSLLPSSSDHSPVLVVG